MPVKDKKRPRAKVHIRSSSSRGMIYLPLALVVPAGYCATHRSAIFVRCCIGMWSTVSRSSSFTDRLSTPKQRCWHDAEDVPPPNDPFIDPILRPLKHGEVAVSFISDHTEHGVLSESELRLVDRTIPPGEVCKRTIDDVQSGVILNVHVKGRLAHVISGEEIPDWKTLDDLKDRKGPEIGDYVIYDDWIGQVRPFNCLSARLSYLHRLRCWK